MKRVTCLGSMHDTGCLGLVQLSPLTVQLCAPLLRNPRWFPPHPGESWEPSQAVPRLSTARLSPWPSLALFSPRSSPQGPVHHYKVPHTSASIPVSLLPCLQFSLFLVLMPSHVRLRDPLDCSPPGSSVHGISQARVLDRKSTRLNSSHKHRSRMPSSA